MGQVKSMIPEGVLRHKSPDRRNRVFKTYFDLNRKSEKAKTKPEKAKKQTRKAKQKLVSWLLHRLLAS